MKTQLRIYLFIATILGSCTLASAQVANNDCATAIPITTLDGQCSGSGAYTNVGATASGQGPQGCFTNVNHDVWFSFVAQATDVTITINGNNTSAGGTLNNPQVGLLSGTCGGTLTMFHCATDVGANTNGVEIYGGALTLGQTYFVRIDGSNTGTFELCINNYFAPPDPQSDCDNSVVLCDKSSFTVQSVSGAGSNGQEMSGSPCGLTETNSSWYTWTCDQSGTLEFALTPTNQADDLDFIVFKFSGNDCTQKSVVRCMAAGDFAFPSPCMGPTGLGNGATDASENPGCSQGQDSWLAPLNMVAGERYALVVNNYTSSGNGFQISFGGSATFVGPDADFLTNDADNTICVGESIVLTDASTFPNGSTGWAWNFGVDATPQVAGGTGPHTLSYTSPGAKSVALTVESTLGCVVSTVKTIQVDPCCETANPISASYTATPAICPGAPEGSFFINASTGHPPFDYQWNYSGITGANGANLYASTYTVTMTDEIGCDTILDIQITEPTPFNVDISVGRPTCGGGTNGSIALTTNGATPNYQYDWGAGLTNNNVQNGLGDGIYNVTIQDAAGCDTVLSIPVEELTLELDTLADFVIPPSCFGSTDGSIIISMANGQAPYMFDWNDGNGFVTSNTLNNLGQGTYTLNVVDANQCQGGPFQIMVEEPETLIVTIIGTDVTCYNETDGQAAPNITGGNGSYTYNWSNGITDSITMNLVSGNYQLTVTDLKGCTDTASIFINQPLAVSIPSIDVTDAFCYGDSNGVLTVNVAGGTPPFDYSIDGMNYQSSNALGNLSAGLYTVYVRDVFGCSFTKSASVGQPGIFYIDAGEDQTIELGYEAEIDAFVNTLELTNYNWTPSESLNCSICEDPTAKPVETTTYHVAAENAKGCPASDSVTVFVEIKRPYFVPNAFTPNFDGENDYFYVYGGPAIQRVKTLRVFDRWGGHVFKAENIPANQKELGWDGTYRGAAVEPGVFTFYIEIEFIDGYVEVIKGDITLLK